MEFSSFQAALRIRRVQLLCIQNGLDGVLLVPGVDGRFSVCNQAMGYLFEGRSNRDTIDVVKLDGQLDDAVALVTPTEVQLYSPDADLREQLQALLLPHVASFRILSPTIAEAANPDLLEENKLASFVHMLHGCRRLGIPCSLAPAGPSPSPPPPGHGAPREVSSTSAAPHSNGGPPPPPGHSASLLPQLGAEQLMALEKWPLLQAYGLEGVGRSGFFTMNFKVFDVQPYMQYLYGELDGRSLAMTVSEAVPTLRQHWDEMLQALGGKAAGQRGALSEKQVVEPLAGYFAYGLLRAAPGVAQTVSMTPRVVFGPRSSDDSARSEAAPLSRCGSCPASPPLHMVVEAADPRSPLRVGRSYFLARGVVAPDVFADPDEDAEAGYSFTAATSGWQGAAEEVVLLMRVYTALMEAARAAMSHFATVDGATALSAKAEAQEVLSRRAEQLGVAGAGAGGPSSLPLASRLRFTLVQADHANRVTAPAVRGSRQLKVLRLSLPDICCRGKLLGGLVYADTFLELPQPPSPASEQQQQGAAAAAARGLAQGGGGGGGGSRWRLLVLTEAVPPLVAIPAGGCEEELAARALRSLARVVEGMTGNQGQLRATTLATQRDLERKAAAAAAESQALAARLRARRLGAAAPETEEVEDLEEEEEEEVAAGAEAATAAAAAAATAAAPKPEEALGRLLTVGGGDEAVLLTGAPSCPALSGALYCFSAGAVFVEAASRTPWVLDLRGSAPAPGAPACGVEAVTMQQLPLAQAHPPAARWAAAGAVGPGAAEGEGGAAVGLALGEAVVFRGASPACGLAPACHLTTNTHLALPLEAMSPAARRFLIQSVLPAWQQTCRETATAAAELRPSAAAASSSPASYLKDMGAPNPFPLALHRAHAYAIQSSSAGGPVKASWPAVMSEDAAVRSAIEGLDAAELQGPLSGLDPSVEALLLQPPPTPTPAAGPAAAAAGGGAVTLVAALPGADQAAVAAAVAAMLGQEAAPRVALLPPDEGPMSGEHFAAALAAAAAAPAAAAARHLILATSSYTGLAEQLRMLAAAAVGGAAGRWRLAAVVVCCSADVSYEEPARSALAVGVLAQLLPGCVDCVVLGGGDAAKVSQLAALVSSRLPEVPVVRSGRAQLMRARQELLPPQAERAARLAAPEAVAARRWAPLEARRGGCGCSAGGLLGSLRATRVVFEGAIDVAKLRDALAPLGLPQDPSHVPPLPLADAEQAEGAAAATRGSLVCVVGCARLSPSGGGAASELVATRQTALRAVREWPLAEAAVVLGSPALPANSETAGGELLFIGSGGAVEEAQLRELMARCGAAAGAATAAAAGAAVGGGASAVPASAAQLSAAQRAEIRQAHLFDPLPEGYCFNGTQYFDAFGDASLEHPDMDRFIAEWIAEQRAKAAKAQEEAGACGPVVVRVAGPAWW